VKTLLAGAGLALVAGLLMGSAMKPDLISDDRPIGPQIFAGWSGNRSTGPFDDSGTSSAGLSYAAYGSEVPDYVTGTDWKVLASATTAAAPPPARDLQDESDAAEPLSDRYADTGDYAPAAYVAPEPEREVRFPSMDGGVDVKPAHVRTDAERGTKALPVDIEPGAPPEATGDTTPANR
jgi:hypothetical protein